MTIALPHFLLEISARVVCAVIYASRSASSSRSMNRPSGQVSQYIRRMSEENPLWGAPRIHGELLKLGFELAESTVSNGMDRPCSRP